MRDRGWALATLVRALLNQRNPLHTRRTTPHYYEETQVESNHTLLTVGSKLPDQDQPDCVHPVAKLRGRLNRAGEPGARATAGVTRLTRGRDKNKW